MSDADCRAVLLRLERDIFLCHPRLPSPAPSAAGLAPVLPHAPAVAAPEGDKAEDGEGGEEGDEDAESMESASVAARRARLTRVGAGQLLRWAQLCMAGSPPPEP